MTQTTEESSIGAYLESPLTLGEPVTSGSLTVYPVFGPEPRQTYISLKDAIGKGLTVKELPGGGSVRDLAIQNTCRHNVLVFEGEEVLGAQQNRTFDKSVLIPAGSQLVVPVSCVEAGRWDGSRNSEAFTPSPQAAHPKLRSRKAMQANRARIAGLEERADQGQVWSDVGDRSAALGVKSSTSALHDAYESRRSELQNLTAPIGASEGQIGMIAVIGGEVGALDLVSRPEVFADLQSALVQGYGLDAIAETGDASKPLTDAQVEEFVRTTVDTRILEGDGIGLGRDFRFESNDLVGAGLVSGDELVQLSVFPADRDEASESGGPVHPIPARTRIQRPSRRRDR